MNLLAISDLHLSPNTPERNSAFIAFLQRATEQGDCVLIAGDLFDLWFGLPNLTFSYQKPILKEMRDLSNAGLVMYYVEGNRDFRISRYAGSLFDQVATISLNLTWNGRSIYAVHGDLINTDDRMYRAWRKISKNFLSYFAIEHLIPSALMLKMAERLESKMKSTNRKYKTYYPEQHFHQFHHSPASVEADIVVIGHFHMERETAINRGNKDVLFYNLPGWENSLRYLVIPPTSEKPYFCDWGL
jgi:UDP-2,3-diacylglucosamine hydrolase